MSIKQRIAGALVGLVAAAVVVSASAISTGTSAGRPTAPGAPGTAVSVAAGVVHSGPESTLEAIAQR